MKRDLACLVFWWDKLSLVNHLALSTKIYLLTLTLRANNIMTNAAHMMYLLKKLLVDVFTFGKDFQGANFEYRQAIYLLMTQLDRDGKK